jgi:formate transporter
MSKKQEKLQETVEDALVLPKPPEIAEQAQEDLEQKASRTFLDLTILGLLAGVYIAFGGLFATVALGGAEGAMPHGMAQVVAGLVFTLGLVLVIVGGAELFTGNTLMVIPLAQRRISLQQLLSAWGIVYVANFVGSLLIALAALIAMVHMQGDGVVGQVALETADAKAALGWGESFFSGILANMLVCLAVWLAYSGRTTADKILAIILPIAAFVAAGLEHSVANMFLVPFGLMVKLSADASFWADIGASATQFPALTLWGALNNLIPVTLGNIVGGAAIGTAYWYAYLR